MSTTAPAPDRATRTKDAARDFLAHSRIAVTGVSREPQAHGANVVFRRLRDRGYDVVPVNPHAAEVEGAPCWPDLRSVPGGVEAVALGRAAGLTVIDGGCPCMYAPTADPGHRLMKRVLTLTGRVPRRV